ncbi:hypothetical protein [Paraflavitalea speifideaquila]|uniref:hypothetical protein n=1 Tax=Paraflavitalea speifideaquila TaxID=3076558 RepID=UPI0028E9C425|nr:hypothetical protein [Paraflavitalea speifideiaquila]
MPNDTEILPGWKLSYEELSSNIFKVSLTDRYGRIASSTEAGFENTLAIAEKHAYEIEMSINKHPNKFLYDYLLSKLEDRITLKGESNAYGTWGIETDNKQLVLEGRDDVLLTKEYQNNKSSWEIVKVLSVKDLDYERIEGLVQFLIS